MGFDSGAVTQASTSQSFLDKILYGQDSVATDNSFKDTKVYLGGQSIGLSIKPSGVIVSCITQVNSSVGQVSVKSGLEKGDIILALNNHKVNSIIDLSNIMAEYSHKDNSITITIMRDNVKTNVTAYPVKEDFSNCYRLGIEIKETADGVGTLSYVDTNGSFGSLGHSINNGSKNSIVPCSGGNTYKCNIIGHTKGKSGTPGELKGVYVDTLNPTGRIFKNTKFGVYGKLNSTENLTLIDVGSRGEVKPGKAEIYTSVNNKVEKFSVDIIKATSQKKGEEKGIVFKVTDKALLKTTGGIVQGMSGSPIVQNGKLVGAVTHVFINDPTKGYGTYIDNMLELSSEIANLKTAC